MEWRGTGGVEEVCDRGDTGVDQRGKQPNPLVATPSSQFAVADPPRCSCNYTGCTAQITVTSTAPFQELLFLI